MVQISELISYSALQFAGETSPSRLVELQNSPDEPLISLGRVDDVLYLPSVLDTGQSLQIVAGRFVPVEATLDSFTLEFVQARRLLKKITKYDEKYDIEHVDRDVCILGNVFSRNFTHWNEELFKVCILQRAGVQCDFVFSQLPGFARDTLSLLGIADSRIHEIVRPTRFRSAYYSTPISYENVWEYPSVLLILRAALNAAADADPPNCGPRVWLDRGEQTRLGRKLVNAEEVYRVLEEFDVKRFDMATVPLAQQIAVAQRMDVMVGLHGSQFVHSQLMPARSSIVECFSPLYMNPTYTSIYHVLDHRYSQITARNTPVFPYAHGGDVTVDCLQLRLALRHA